MVLTVWMFTATAALFAALQVSQFLQVSACVYIPLFQRRHLF